MTPRSKNRLILLLVVALFAAPMGVALLLNMQGWKPEKTRNHGRLIEPPQDVSAVPVMLRDGSRLVWRDPQWQWTLLALPGAQCADTCRERLDEALRMRITLGRNAERVRIVYLGADSGADFIAARAPLVAGSDDSNTFAPYRAQASDSLALALVDPNGLLILHYADGYSAAGLREDIVRVLH